MNYIKVDINSLLKQAFILINYEIIMYVLITTENKINRNNYRRPMNKCLIYVIQLLFKIK